MNCAEIHSEKSNLKSVTDEPSPQTEVRLTTNKSKNSTNTINNNININTESSLYSNNSRFDVENNIVQVKSKYGRKNESNKQHVLNALKEDNNSYFNDENKNKIKNKKFYKNNSSVYYYGGSRKKGDFSEIKNSKINKTLNDNVFKEVKKNIINLEYPIEQDAAGNKHYMDNSSSNKHNNNFNKSTFTSSETQTQINFIDKKSNMKIKSNLTPSALTISNPNSGGENNCNYFSKKNNLSNSSYYNNNNSNSNNHESGQINSKANILSTNYAQNIVNYLEPIMSNAENSSPKNSNKVIYTTNSNLYQTSNVNMLHKQDEKRETAFYDTMKNLPSLQNTSKYNTLKSKNTIFTKIDSLFKNRKIKKVFGSGRARQRDKKFKYEANESNDAQLHGLTTKNFPGNEKNKVVLEFQYPPGSSSSRSSKTRNDKKENEASSLNLNNNINYNNDISYNSGCNAKGFHKNDFNRSCTAKEQQPSKDAAIINNNNEINSNAENSRISINSRSGSRKRRNNSNSGRNKRSNSIRSIHSPSSSCKKDKNISLNAVNLIKDTPQYFLNRNIMEEYEKIKSHTRKSSENQIIYSELKYKLDIMHENKSNFTNLLNEEIIKGNVRDNNSFILPKI